MSRHLRIESGIPDYDPVETSLFRMLRVSADKVVSEWGKLDPSTPLESRELKMISECTNYAEYRHTCNVIKMRRSESYPPDWWSKVMISGLLDALMKRIDNPENSDFKTQVEAIVLPLLGVGQ